MPADVPPVLADYDGAPNTRSVGCRPCASLGRWRPFLPWPLTRLPMKTPMHPLLATGLCRLAAALVTLALAACGGSSGFEPTVTAVQAQSLRYGGTASIYVGGTDLRASMVADLGTGCTSPSFSSNSSTTLAQLTCQVKTTGALPLKISTAEGKVVYQGSLTVANPQVQLVTSKGNITLELDPSKAPITVDNFLAYVKAGFYSNTIFHRVIPGFVVQGGGYTSGVVPQAGLKSPITLESNNGLSNLRGTVAMARTNDPNTATSQFFVNLVDNAFLNYKDASNPGYAVFGKVVSGLDVVDAIAKEATGTVNGFENVPLSDVTVTKASQVQ